MKSFMTLFDDLQNKKILLFGIILCGAFSSAFKAIIAVITKTLTELIFDENKIGCNRLSDSIDFLDAPCSFSADLIFQLAELISQKPIYIAAFGIALATIMANIFRYIFMYNMRNLTESKAVHLRERLMSHYLSSEGRIKSTDEDSSGGLISRLLNDVLIYQNGLNRMSEALKEPFLIIFSLVYLFILSWKITLFLILALPPSLFVLKRISKSLRKHSTQNQETMEKLTMTLKESLDGDRIIHSFNLEKTMFARFREHTNKYLLTIRKIISREELAGPITESLSAIVLAFTLIIIYNLAQSDGFTMGDFVALLTSIGFLSDSSKKLQNGFIKIQQGVVAKERVNTLIKKTKNNLQKEGELSFPSNLTSVEVKNLFVRFGEKEVLKNISLKVSAGKTVALVGPSGSGKSTFLNILDGYIQKSSGKVLFNESEVSDINSNSLKQSISLVSQDPFLFDGTIFDNLKYANPELTEDQALKVLDLANAGFVRDFKEGISTKVGERGSRLSGGERQRISIARAMVKDSPVILLDEATSALDTQSEMEVQKGLHKLKQNKTCFIVAHRLSTIIDADLILVFEKGKIVELGTHSELMNGKGLYASLYA